MEEEIQANFKIKRKEWDDFIILCRKGQTTASQELRGFIKDCNSMGLLGETVLPEVKNK